MIKRRQYLVRFPVAMYMLTAAILVATPDLNAQIVHLNNGTTIEGVVKRTEDGYDVTDAKGVLTHIALEDVKRIEIGVKATGVVETENRLLSLRRSVENVADLKSIIDRYSRFIEQNKNSPVAKEAEHDLATWHERQANGMVKVGPRWVTVQEREQLKEHGKVVAAEVRDLMRQGRLKDAEPLLQQALDEDPGNLSAAYLKGSLLFKQEQIPAARKWFETVVATLTDHAPSCNNLAVVLWRQNQQLPAMGFYSKAMISSPYHREILNNVAEALNSLPQNQRTSAAAQTVFRLFTEQDTVLQERMAKSGLYRWGSTWVPKQEIDRLIEIEKEIKKQLDAMSIEFDAASKKLSQIDSDIEYNTKRMKTIEDTSYAVDAQGRTVRLSLPPRYYELERANKQLAADRLETSTRLDTLRATAKQAQQQLPTPKFTAVQRLIGAEGTPLLPPLIGIGPGESATPASSRPDLKPPKEIQEIPRVPNPGVKH